LFSSYLEVRAIDLADTARLRQVMIGLECGSLRSKNIETLVISKWTFVSMNQVPDWKVSQKFSLNEKLL